MNGSTVVSGTELQQAFVLDGISIPAFVIDREHRILHWNKALEAISNLPARDMVGTQRHWCAFYDSERPCMADLILDGAVHGDIAQYYAANAWQESRLLPGAYEAEGFFHKLGTAGLWLFFTAAPILDAGGRVIGAIETLQDISERKYAEAELKEYRFHLEDLVESRTAALSRANASLVDANRRLEDAHNMVNAVTTAAKEGIVMIDGAGCIVFWNPAAAGMFGYAASEVEGRNLHALLAPPRFREVANAAFTRFTATGEGAALGKAVELAALRKNGEEFPVELSLAALRHAGEWRAVGIVRDISERKRMQAEAERRMTELARLNVEYKTINEKLVLTQHQLIESEKMASIGGLAAGVAHEINNPVGFVTSNLGSMEKYVENLFAIIDAYEERPDEGSAELSRRVDAIKRDADYRFMREDLGALIAESRQGLARVKRIVQALLEFSQVGATDWRPADLHACLDDVLDTLRAEIAGRATLAKEYGALPAVECLAFELKQVFTNLLVNALQALDKPGTINLRTGTSGEEVWVEIADNGVGIPPEAMSRIFDPFFTTKPVGQGTGLGLAQVYATVKKHGGRIEAKSVLGQGSVFRAYLPVRQHGKS